MEFPDHLLISGDKNGLIIVFTLFSLLFIAKIVVKTFFASKFGVEAIQNELVLLKRKIAIVWSHIRLSNRHIIDRPCGKFRWKIQNGARGNLKGRKIGIFAKLQTYKDWLLFKICQMLRCMYIERKFDLFRYSLVCHWFTATFLPRHKSTVFSWC